MDNKNTNQGVELLRLFLMLFIVIEHYIGHGGGLLNVINNENTVISSSLIQWLLYSPCVMAVDCFLFISGYFGMSFRLNKVVDLSLQAISTSLIVLLVTWICNVDITPRELISMFLPIGCNFWWFLTLYIVLLCMSNFLNKYSEFNTKDRLAILLLLAWINSFGGLLFNTAGANLGYSLLNFIFMYLLGRELRLRNFFKNKYSYYLLLYIISLGLIYIIVFSLRDFGPGILKRVYAYNNPLIIINAIFFFGIFFKISSNINIRSISKYSFGIYLFHDNPILRNILTYIYSDSFIIFVPLCIFFICLLIEMLRFQLVRIVKLVFSKLKV